MCVVTMFSLRPAPRTLHSQLCSHGALVLVADGISWLLSKPLRPPGPQGLENGGVRVDDHVFHVLSL